MKINHAVVLITGGASGLGEACARRFIGHGGRAALLDFDADRGSRIAAELGENARFFRADVTDEASISAAVDGTIASFGAIHAVVNCAGIATPAKVVGKNGPMPIDLFARVVNVNLIGTMNVIRLAVFRMKDNPPGEDGERGVIINTASVAAFEGQVGQSAYSASKAGVAGMTLTLAREFADLGIRVVSIAPGLFDTPMMAGIPDKIRNALSAMPPFPKRLGRPDEFAGLAEHIIENAVLNGETIRLDSALRMSHK